MDSVDDRILSMDEKTWRLYVNQKFEESGAWRNDHQKAIEENTALTRQVAKAQCDLVESTAAIVEALEITKSGARFMTRLGGWVNKFAKWALPIVTLCGAIWAVLNGRWPHNGS